MSKQKTTNYVKCPWCGNPPIESHITPGNIYRVAQKYLGVNVKELRPLLTPNRVVQDIGKPRLLCKDCDNTFSEVENTFRNQMYVPLLTGSKQFPYEEWLTRFVISIAWKRLVTGIGKLDLSGLDPNLPQQAAQAAQCWKDYLRGKRQDAGHYEHHMFFTWFLDKQSISKDVWVLFRTTFETTLFPL
jgi:hypothetical protein